MRGLGATFAVAFFLQSALFWFPSTTFPHHSVSSARLGLGQALSSTEGVHRESSGAPDESFPFGHESPLGGLALALCGVASGAHVPLLRVDSGRGNHSRAPPVT